MKKYIALALILVMVLSLVACGGGGGETEPGPETALVGTWTSEDGKEMDFTADGKGNCYTVNGLKAECTWTYLAESDEFELAAMAFGKATVKIADNAITWYDVVYTKAS